MLMIMMVIVTMMMRFNETSDLIASNKNSRSNKSYTSRPKQRKACAANLKEKYALGHEEIKGAAGVGH